MQVSRQKSAEIGFGRRKPALPRWLLAAALLCVAGVGGVMIAGSDAGGERSSHRELKPTAAHRPAKEPGNGTGESDTSLAVSIRKPSGPPRIATGLRDLHGFEITAACSACHTTHRPNHESKTARDLDEFHGGMSFSHGTLSCLSCHNERDYDALKLADGSRVEFSEVMSLCAQCHGRQWKDYQHGAHGGMNGYWDTTRGGRTKLNCVDCHPSHTPQFPRMQPTFKPSDRFLNRQRADH